jgi:hypothetical protein
MPTDPVLIGVLEEDGRRRASLRWWALGLTETSVAFSDG